MKPISEALDNKEKSINIGISNVVWLSSKESNWIDSNSKGVKSFLLQDKVFKSLFIKLPIGYSGLIETNGTVLHSVIIHGELNYTMSQNKEIKVLDAGSYFGSTTKTIHTVSNNSGKEIILYIRSNGEIKVK